MIDPKEMLEAIQYKNDEGVRSKYEEELRRLQVEVDEAIQEEIKLEEQLDRQRMIVEEKQKKLNNFEAHLVRLETLSDNIS